MAPTGTVQFEFGAAPARGAEAQRKPRRTLVRFETAAGHWAVAIDRVREIRKAAGIVALPNAQSGVAGVLRRGDEVITVLSALGDGQSHIIVLESAGLRFGLLCDSASGILRIDEDEIVARSSDSLVSGVIETEEGAVRILDVDELGCALRS